MTQHIINRSFSRKLFHVTGILVVLMGLLLVSMASYASRNEGPGFIPFVKMHTNIGLGQFNEAKENFERCKEYKPIFGDRDDYSRIINDALSGKLNKEVAKQLGIALSALNQIVKYNGNNHPE